MSPTSDVIAQVSLALSYPELLRVAGPLLSLVLRTEDVWQRYNQFIETFRGLSMASACKVSQNVWTCNFSKVHMVD